MSHLEVKRFTDEQLDEAVMGAGMSSTLGATYKKLGSLREARPLFRETISGLQGLLDAADDDAWGYETGFGVGLEAAIAILERKARLPEGGES